MNSDPGRDVGALIIGGGVVDRRLSGPMGLLDAYREDEGTRYLNHVPITPPDRLLPEDLAVTILINSRVGYRAFKSVQDLGPSLDLDGLPTTSLEDTTSEERDLVAGLIAQVAAWPGFAASVATKVLHKKRQALIPILDNQAIFGSYMTATWPNKRSSQESVESESRIRDALERITTDLTRDENREVWPVLHGQEPRRSRIELFDMVWWSYFRSIEDTSGTLRARLDALAAFLPAFERADLAFGKWAGGGDEDGVIQMPYYSFDPDAERFVAMAYEFGWVTQFDWGEWAQTPEGRELLEGSAALESATPDDLAHILTTIIRAERFGDGQLEHAFSSGLLLAIARRAGPLASVEPSSSG